LLVNSPFVPGLNEKPELPLARFLPPLPAGMSHQWISSNIPRGSWILDPFGNSPELALELARSGYQVLVTANNPVNSFLIEVLSLAPTKLELEEALGLLANATAVQFTRYHAMFVVIQSKSVASFGEKMRHPRLAFLAPVTIVESQANRFSRLKQELDSLPFLLLAFIMHVRLKASSHSIILKEHRSKQH
jgi:hypothetical protein